MRRRVIWIAVATTMTFWLGCAGSGGDQNYKILNEEQPKIDSDPGGEMRTGPSSALPFSFIQAADAQESSSSSSSIPPAFKNSPPVTPALAPGPGTQPLQPAMPLTLGPVGHQSPGPVKTYILPRLEIPPKFVSDTVPSLDGLDRSHWPKFVYKPDSGRSIHGAILFRDYDTDTDHYMTVHDGQSAEKNIWAALASPFAENWDEHNTGDFLGQQGKFAFDLIVLPYNALVSEPASKEYYTPPLRNPRDHNDYTAIPTERVPPLDGESQAKSKVSSTKTLFYFYPASTKPAKAKTAAATQPANPTTGKNVNQDPSPR